MIDNTLSIEVDDELISSVRATCSEFGVELEDLIRDYLSFAANLDDSVIEEVKKLPTEEDKAQWLAKYYLNGNRK